MKKLNSKTDFNKIKSKFGDYHLIDYIIDFELEFTGIIESAKFFNCTFKKDTIIRGTFRKDVEFIDCTFEKSVHFSESTFDKNIRFYKTKFLSNTYFFNTVFRNLCDFWGAEFNENVIFQKTDFLGTTVLSSAIFKENVLFTYSLISKTLILRNTNFEKGLDLSLSIIEGTISPFNMNLKDYDCENDTNDSLVYEECVSDYGLIPEKNKRETFRLLKAHYLKQSNSIDALTFSQLERSTYYSQIKKRLVKKPFNFKSVTDFIIFGLNKLSNNHGTAFLQAIIFTLVIGFIFYYFSLIATENYAFVGEFSKDNLNEIIKNYFTFLIPTHKINYLEFAKPNSYFYLWDLLGRIFVSYGIYQTIQGFRKYKK